MSHSIDKSINLTRVAEIMHAKSTQTAYVEHAGKGVASLYAGTLARDAEGEDRYQLIAGPGWFDLDGVAYIGFDDFEYGSDDDGQSNPRFITEGTEEAVATILLSFIKEKSLIVRSES
jgi:hypothetical protein